MVLEELDIHPESFTSFENDLREYAKIAYKYYRACAEAQKMVDTLNFQLDLLSGEILQEITTKKKIPPSALSEIRRSEVPLDERYKVKKYELIDATETLNILLGTVKSFESRSYRLGDIAEMKKKLLKDDYVVLEDEAIRQNLKSL